MKKQNKFEKEVLERLAKIEEAINNKKDLIYTPYSPLDKNSTSTYLAKGQNYFY